MRSRTGYFVYKYVVSDEIIYVGIASDIVRRVHDHRRCGGLDKKFAPYINKAEIYVHECTKESEMRALETLLIDFYKPILNETGKTDIPSSLSPAGSLLSWILYDEKEYVSPKEPHKYVGSDKKPYRPRYSANTIQETKINKAELLRAIEIIEAFPSLLVESNPLSIPGKVNMWDASEHLPQELCVGKSAQDINLAFAQTNLAAVGFRSKNESGIYSLCKGVLTIESEQGAIRTFIRVNTEHINEMLMDAEALLNRYDEILEYDEGSDEYPDSIKCENRLQYIPNPWEGKDTDLPEALSWENIKNFMQYPVESTDSRMP